MSLTSVQGAALLASQRRVLLTAALRGPGELTTSLNRAGGSTVRWSRELPAAGEAKDAEALLGHHIAVELFFDSQGSQVPLELDLSVRRAGATRARKRIWVFGGLICGVRACSGPVLRCRP
jgi:hypothetical protein